MADLTALPPAVRAYVQGYVARGRRLALVRRAGFALTVLLVWAMLCCGVDRFIQLPAGLRLAALLAGAVAVVAILGGPVRRWLGVQADWIAVAQEIERQNPRFDQRLVTVTSRLLGRPEHRGSDEILEHLVYQVDREVSEQRSAAPLPIRSAMTPWLMLLLTSAAAGGLCFVPGLRLPQLGARFAAPWAAIAPVTTASLSVYPGNLDVPQSNPLQVDAEALRVEGSQVWVNISDDGTTWSRTAMIASSVGPTGDGRYSFTLASVDRDLQYYVSGGDARSPRYAVRVLRRPAVSEFNIRYTYPAYTGKPPMTVSNTDGVIEGPVGTEALVTITATEPLQLALFTAPGGEKALFARAGADNLRQGRVTVQRDGRYQLDLVSTREVTGGGPPTMEVRAQPDHPPVVRLAEAGTTLHLNPRDILPLSYDIMDDYGLDAVTVRVQSGIAPAFELPVYPEPADAYSMGPAGSAGGGAAAGAGPAVLAQRIEPPSRRIGGEFDLDLANLPLTIGDALTIVVSAKDTGGQSASAAPVQVLVSPRSVEPEAYDRMAALADASRLVDALSGELAAALKSAEAASADSAGGTSAATARRDRHVTAAIESAAMARRAMLRATAHGAAPPLCVAIAAWVDSAQTISSHMAELVHSEETVGATQQARPEPVERAASLESIRHAAELCREMQSSLKTISQGERAAAILADRESLVSAESRPAPPDGRGERLKQTLQRIREEIAASAAEISLDANAADFESQLRAKIATAAFVISSQHVIDFAAVTRAWVARGPQIHNGPPTPGPADPGLAAPSIRPLRERERDRRGELSDRLLAAAEAEALRRDADLIRARDLQLASRAAAMLAVQPAAKINELAAALSALQQESELNRRPAGPDRPEDASIHDSAARAREQLEHWAGEASHLASTRSTSPRTMPTIALARAEKAETLALFASAASARRQYGEVAETDRALRQAVERLVAPTTGPDPTSAPEASSERSETRLTQQGRLAQSTQEVARTMKAAQEIDGLTDGQQKLAEQTRGAKEEAAPTLAEKQRELADQISQLTPVKSSAAIAVATGSPGNSGTGSEDPNWRDRAVATILSAQVQLSAMPQQLSEALAAADDWRRAADRAKAAHGDADAAPAEHKPAAVRAAAQADQDTTDAARRLESAAAPLALSAGDALVKSLEPFAPEATVSRAAITEVLRPAMNSLSDALHSQDPGAAARFAGAVRQAIDAAQVELARARDEVAQRDPLVAAKWFARAAADALGRKPPDFILALQDQDLTHAALARAWDASVHHAASLRLAELPAMHALYAPEPLTGDGSRLAGGARPTGAGIYSTAGASATPAVARNWRHLAPRDGDNAAATPHQSDPAGYEAALKAYFEALGNVGGGGADK